MFSLQLSFPTLRDSVPLYTALQTGIKEGGRCLEVRELINAKIIFINGTFFNVHCMNDALCVSVRVVSKSCLSTGNCKLSYSNLCYPYSVISSKYGMMVSADMVFIKWLNGTDRTQSGTFFIEWKHIDFIIVENHVYQNPYKHVIPVANVSYIKDFTQKLYSDNIISLNNIIDNMTMVNNKLKAESQEYYKLRNRVRSNELINHLIGLVMSALILYIVLSTVLKFLGCCVRRQQNSNSGLFV